MICNFRYKGNTTLYGMQFQIQKQHKVVWYAILDIKATQGYMVFNFEYKINTRLYDMQF